MKDNISKGSLILMFIVLIANLLIYIMEGITFFIISLFTIPFLFIDYKYGGTKE